MKTVVYKVRVNRPCYLFVDDVQLDVLDECSLREFVLPPGEYLRKVVSIDTRCVAQEDVICLSGDSVVDNIVLDITGLNAAKMRAFPYKEMELNGLEFGKALSDDGVSLCDCTDEEMTEVVIPDQIRWGHYLYDVVEISGFAFYGKDNLREVVIPNTVRSIGEVAFEDCTQLVSLHIPSSVLEIGEYAFAKCKNLSSLIIPSSVKVIGEYAFDSCKKIKFLTIEEGVTIVGDGVFCDCEELLSVEIPTSLEKISSYMFGGCKSLSSVAIPDSVYEIGNFAFEDCSSLRVIDIPDSVDTIGRDAFPPNTKVKRVENV